MRIIIFAAMEEFNVKPFIVGVFCLLVAGLYYMYKKSSDGESTYPERFKKRRIFLEWIFIACIIATGVFFFSLSVSFLKPVRMWFVANVWTLVCIASTTFAGLMIVNRNGWRYKSKFEHNDWLDRYQRREKNHDYWFLLIFIIMVAILSFCKSF